MFAPIFLSINSITPIFANFLGSLSYFIVTPKCYLLLVFHRIDCGTNDKWKFVKVVFLERLTAGNTHQRMPLTYSKDYSNLQRTCMSDTYTKAAIYNSNRAKLVETWNFPKNKLYYSLKLKIEITGSATVSFTTIYCKGLKLY